LKSEFGWSETSAQRFLRAWRAFESGKLPDLGLVEVGALHLLSVRSTPEAVHAATIKRTEEGQRVTHADVKQMIVHVRKKGVPPGEAEPESSVEAEPATQFVPAYVEYQKASAQDPMERARLYLAESIEARLRGLNELAETHRPAAAFGALAADAHERVYDRAIRGFAWLDELIELLRVATGRPDLRVQGAMAKGNAAGTVQPHEPGEKA
jgi:hypothetical protein